jgi:hypothetical protein
VKWKYTAKRKNPQLKPQYVNNLSAESVDVESHFKVEVESNEWQLQSYYESEDHPAIEDVKFIRKIKFPAKVLL